MFFKLNVTFLFLLAFLNGRSQLSMQNVSNSDLIIWSTDQLYIYEFYIENDGLDAGFKLELESTSENTSFHIGLGNKLINDSSFEDSLCAKEKILVRIFFKNLPLASKSDSILIRIHQDTTTYESNFTYNLAQEKVNTIKIFQDNFTKYLIMDIDYGSVKEVILYTKDRSKFEHIKSRSRLLDLSFLEKGQYIIEINNEEYIINKM